MKVGVKKNGSDRKEKKRKNSFNVIIIIKIDSGRPSETSLDMSSL
jgi:hypothetical protein